MKKIKYISLVLIAIISLSSCKNVLDEDIYNFKTKDQYFRNSVDAETAIRGTYSKLALLYRKAAMFKMTITMSGGYGRDNENGEFVNGTMNSTTREVRDAWRYSYELINTSNDVIYNIGNMDTLVIKKDYKDKLIAEARFLRAWSYFNLVRLYGNVPIKTTPTLDLEDNNLMVGLSPVNDVYKSVIIPDLEFAIEKLNETTASSFAGRVTKYSAYAVLAKVYMTIASMKDNPDTDKFPDFNSNTCWTKSKDAAKEVIDHSSASLVPDFADLWHTDTKNTSESLFEVQYSRGVDGGSFIAKYFTPAGSKLAARGGGFGWGRCTMKNYNDFYTAYGPGTSPAVSDTMDYRLEKTFITKYIKYGKNPGDVPKVEYTYPVTYINKGKVTPAKAKETYVGKWRDPKAPDNFMGENNFTLIRLADVYLMYAEALNELGEANPEDYVNRLLSRSRDADGINPRTTPADWIPGDSQLVLREKIWNERRFELAAEMHLWFDLVRRGSDFYINFIKADNSFVDDVFGEKAYQHVITEKNVLFPIPLTEISANNEIDISDQNTGY